MVGNGAHHNVPPTGLVELDEGKGNTAKDISKNGNHAKLVDAKWTQDGKHGKAVEFDGTNHVKIAASKPLIR